MTNSAKVLPTALLLIALSFVVAPSATAGGTVTACNEIALKTALAGGGLVTITCLEKITLTSTIDVFSDTIIDGQGRAAISGGKNVGVIVVRAGANLGLNR